jgi:hypothetical protein
VRELPQAISLLDLGPEDRVVEWWVCFHKREPHFFWAKWLKQGFRHVELMRPYHYGPGLTDVMWLVLRPNLEILENHIEMDPTPPWTKYPGVTVVRVQVLMKAWKVRQWFFAGPPSCTEIVKSALCIKSFFMRTPYQLYKYLIRHHGVLGVD